MLFLSSSFAKGPQTFDEFFKEITQFYFSDGRTGQQVFSQNSALRSAEKKKEFPTWINHLFNLDEVLFERYSEEKVLGFYGQLFIQYANSIAQKDMNSFLNMVRLGIDYVPDYALHMYAKQDKSSLSFQQRNKALALFSKGKIEMGMMDELMKEVESLVEIDLMRTQYAFKFYHNKLMEFKEGYRPLQPQRGRMMRVALKYLEANKLQHFYDAVRRDPHYYLLSQSNFSNALEGIKRSMDFGFGEMGLKLLYELLDLYHDYAFHTILPEFAIKYLYETLNLEDDHLDDFLYYLGGKPNYKKAHDTLHKLVCNKQFDK